MFIVMLAAATALAITVFLVAFAVAFAVRIFAMAAVFTLTAMALMRFKRLQFFFGSFADFDHFDSEVQVLAGQFVVSIDNSLVAIDGLDANGHGTCRSLGIELHTGFNLVDTLENANGNFLSHTFVVFAVTFGGDHLDVELVANFMTDHGLFETNNDHMGTLDVLQRVAASGRVYHLTFVRSKSVVHQDNGLVSNLHKNPLFNRAAFSQARLVLVRLA